MICAIHQPNFFPWLGYFDKIYRADIFVFLDMVDYPKSSKTMSSWTNRVAMKIQDKKQWISIPVQREKGAQLIGRTRISRDDLWRPKLIKTLEYSYSKTPCFTEVIGQVEKWLNRDCEYISDYNISIIREISALIGLETVFLKQSDICTTQHSTRLLIEIVRAVEGDVYLCGGGASGYQEDELFDQHGIELRYQNYKHPTYHQAGTEFIEGLSILDALFNMGFEGTGRLIRSVIL